tara:strand:- start:89 stop:976 length:888 start_codon:yes stop_codon:yes gene_type:complete
MIKKILKILLPVLILCNSSYAVPIVVKKTKWHHMDIKKHFEIVTENVRLGKTAQKFEIRHGECKKQDCKWGAHRTEKHLKIYQYSKKKFKDPVFYAVSIFIPEDFGYDFVASKMSMFQAKMKGVDMPLWMVSTQGAGFQVRLGHYKRCSVHSFKKGTWNDFVVKTNYSRERIKDEKYFELWWNGKKIDECTHYIPFVTKKHIKESKSHGWSSNKQQINMRYGIYKFRVGDYLSQINKNKPKNMKTMTQPSGQKNIIKPFKYNWEIKIPTTAMLFDEIRFGKSFSEVDIKTNDPVD